MLMPIAVLLTVHPFLQGSSIYGNLSSHTSQVPEHQGRDWEEKVSLIATQLSFKIP